MPENKDIERRKSDEIELRTDNLVQRSLEYLKEFEEQGLANVEEPDLEGWDLHRAIHENRIDIARALFVRGVVFDGWNAHPDPPWSTPLHCAARANSLDIAQLLIVRSKRTADDERWEGVNNSDESCYTPLCAAAKHNSVAVARLLIAHGAVDFVEHSTYATSALHQAAYGNSLDVARLLIENGADVNYGGYGHNGHRQASSAPLHWAAWRNSTEVASLLIDHGAEIEARDTDGNTPLHGASMENSTDVARLLIEKGADTDGIDLSWMDDQEDDW